MFVYTSMLVLLGFSILGVAWLPSLLARFPLSYPILYVGLGVLAYSLPLQLPAPDPLEHTQLATHLTELGVIISLTGTGLKIDQPFTLRLWAIPLRLVSVGMLLTVSLMAVTGWLLAGLLPASALLLAAALAPTDPVLAGDVQVGDPNEGGEDTVRFALTGEAGLNDGLAFPFVYLAMALLPAASTLSERLWHWLWMDLGYRIGMGILAGWLSGKLLSYLIVGLPKKISIKASAYGFVALAVTLLTYGITEKLSGYGFLAVFVAALTLRGYERTHEYHQQMHSFSDQIERILIVILLIFFGGAIVNGLLNALTWQGALLGLLLVVVMRPLVGMLTLYNSEASWGERWVISGFGIRGIGSFFYIAYALEKADFAQSEQIWAIGGFVVLVSIFIHGILATPVMNWLDRQQSSKPS